jgi:hypothetical protein
VWLELWISVVTTGVVNASADVLPMPREEHTSASWQTNASDRVRDLHLPSAVIT